MARDNIISFARNFQESFQRQQQIELQRQREERFDRQLIANADFQQSQLNFQRQRLDLAERQFERGPSGSFGAVQLGRQTGVINRRTGDITETAFPSARVAGDTGRALPGRFGVAAQLKETGLTGTALTQATQNIPLDLNQGEAEGFLLGSDESVLPFFEQGILGFGKMKFGKQLGVFNVNRQEVTGPFKDFLRNTNFATKTTDQQTGILRAFEESLGVDITGDNAKTAVPRDEIDFDLQSPFFQSIIKAERAKTQEGNPFQKALDENKITQNEFDSINRGIQAGTITSDQALERIK